MSRLHASLTQLANFAAARAGIVRAALPGSRGNLVTGAVIVGSLLAGAAYTWFAGEDVNWDWQNYHDYNAFALIHGRYDQDVAPAGIQTFLNPLVYLPAYLLRHHVAAPFWAMLLGAFHGLNLAIIYRLSRTALQKDTGLPTLAASVVIAASGPMTLSEVGTSFADILTALLVIGGVGLLLSSDARDRYRYAIAGIMVGAAVGLKLTNMIFLIGAGASLLYVARPAMALPCFALGSVIGGLITGGAWAWMLWQQFGNPAFPFFNGIFHSPDAPLPVLADGRFLPRTLWDAAAYPFYWLIGDHRSCEQPFRDPRFAILVILFAATAGVSLIRRKRVFALRDKQFLLFFSVSYTVWLLVFSIHRYAIVLELLAAPLIVVLLCRLLRALPTTWPKMQLSHWSSFAAATAALAIALWSQPADWSHRPWSEAYQPVLSAALLSPATYILIEKPVGYVIPLLPAGSRAYQLADILLPIAPGGVLDRRIRDGLADPLPGGIWALHVRGRPPRLGLLDDYGLQFSRSRSCEIIAGADHSDIEACPVIETQRAAQLPKALHSD